MPTLIRLILIYALAGWAIPCHADSASLLAQAQANNPARYQFAVAKNAEIRATTDNKSFTMWWQPSAAATPAGVIVGLHGHGIFATDEFYVWQPVAEKAGYALLVLQWWFGGGEAVSDYYEPKDMYPLIAAILKSKGVKPGTVLFQGFSRGAANSYAMTAIDAVSADRFFGMTLSISGGVIANYPPNQQVVAGNYGSQPYAGIQWVLYCGEKDPDPAINGCPAMRAASDWVARYGANVVLFIDDPNGDHGGFMLNSANVDAAMAAYAAMLAAKAAVNYSDSWWNANESGWGITITDHGTNAFVQWYTYDATGHNQKYVIAGGTFANSRCQFSGSVQRVTGPSWTAATFDPNQVVRTTVGSGSIDFCAAGVPAGTIVFSYNVDGVSASKQLTRLAFGNDVPHWGGSANTGAADFTDLWWNPSESGWGVSVTQHGNNVFFRIFVYDVDGRPLLFVVPGVTFSTPTSFSGALQLTSGPWFGSSPFDPAKVVRTTAGSAALTFTDANNGILTYTVNGVTKTKPITRLAF